MKNFKVLLAFVAFFLVLGWVGHQDYMTEVMQGVVQECNASQGTSQECKRLIAEVQKDGKHEVLADQWAEGRGYGWYVEEK